MKKTIFLLVIVLICSMFNVHAAENSFDVTYNSLTSQLDVSGDASEGTFVTVEVFRQRDYINSDGAFSLSAARSALLSATYPRSVVCFADQTTAGSNGKWAMSLEVVPFLNDSTGLEIPDVLSDIYVISVFEGSIPMLKEVLYIDQAESETSLPQLCALKTSSEETVIQFLKDYKYPLGAYLDIMKTMNTDAAYALMYDELVSADFTFADTDSARKLLQKAIAIEGLNQNKMSSIEDYETELGLTTSAVLSKYYKASFVNSGFKTSMTNRLSAKGFAGAAAFDTAAAKALLLEYAAKTDGVDALANIIADLDATVWGVQTNFSEAAVRSVMGTSFADVTALKTALETYKDETSNGSAGSLRPSKGSVTGSATFTPSDITNPQLSTGVYSDMAQAAWAQEAVEYMTHNGIVSGLGDGTFCPNRNVTRAEFVKMLVNAFGFSGSGEVASFDDVTPDKWYYNYISVACHNGIANGKGNAFFGAEENITRQDMAVMLYNAASAKKLITAADNAAEFADGADIADYALEAVNTFSSAGVISGTGNGCFSPRDCATRAQAAQIIYNLLVK